MDGMGPFFCICDETTRESFVIRTYELDFAMQLPTDVLIGSTFGRDMAGIAEP